VKNLRTNDVSRLRIWAANPLVVYIDFTMSPDALANPALAGSDFAIIPHSPDDTANLM
jgi:hypothetical protein